MNLTESKKERLKERYPVRWYAVPVGMCIAFVALGLAYTYAGFAAENFSPLAAAETSALVGLFTGFVVSKDVIPRAARAVLLLLSYYDDSTTEQEGGA